ncbi:MAG: hypothetical protein OEV49_16560 [candidate division Zixibacteria bacterium]|nr:hypothetical protein [candidate division Zixibacteria bacterium]MDH3936923.1 hypothetical protein [candidate division Zixibacteria bacterium]MDH4032772.1 hypothetical protein [candidate division Zixibacteria bacterium]
MRIPILPKVTAIAWFALLALNVCVVFVAYGQDIKPEWLKESNPVFVGTVLRLGESSVAGVKASQNTAVVKVDALLSTTQGVSIAEGDEITIELIDPTQFRIGSRATFYAETWVMSKSVAVKELGHEPMQAALVAASVGPMKQRLQQARLRKRLDDAETVALGEVVQIRKALTATTQRPRITEHDPNWQEAIIRVDSLFKGTAGVAQLVVRFPGSQDVQFFGAPKFEVDQTGIFLLQRDVETGLPKAMLAGGEVDAFLARRSVNVISIDSLAAVRTALGRQ